MGHDNAHPSRASHRAPLTLRIRRKGDSHSGDPLSCTTGPGKWCGSWGVVRSVVGTKVSAVGPDCSEHCVCDEPGEPGVFYFQPCSRAWIPGLIERVGGRHRTVLPPTQFVDGLLLRDLPDRVSLRHLGRRGPAETGPDAIRSVNDLTYTGLRQTRPLGDRLLTKMFRSILDGPFEIERRQFHSRPRRDNLIQMLRLVRCHGSPGSGSQSNSPCATARKSSTLTGGASGSRIQVFEANRHIA
jgi:hypothetical protein